MLCPSSTQRSRRPVTLVLKGASNVTVNTTTGVVHCAQNGNTCSARVSPVRAALPALPKGQFTAPDGSEVLITDGLGLTLMQNSVDPLALVKTVNRVGKSLFSSSLQSDGLLKLADSGSNSGFTGVAYPDDVFMSGATASASFAYPDGDSKNATYCYVVRNLDVIRQNILPAIADNQFYRSAANFGYKANTNRATGNLLISGTKFSPDYFRAPLHFTDTAYVDMNRDSSGIAYRAINTNGDDIIDYDVITANRLFTGCSNNVFRLNLAGV